MRGEMEDTPVTAPNEAGGDTARPNECGSEKPSGTEMCIFNREIINFALYGKALPNSECTIGAVW